MLIFTLDMIRLLYRNHIRYCLKRFFKSWEKKNQEIKKIKEIKLRKLQENNDLVREKKELRIFEEKLKKEDNNMKYEKIFLIKLNFL